MIESMSEVVGGTFDRSNKEGAKGIMIFNNKNNNIDYHINNNNSMSEKPKMELLAKAAEMEKEAIERVTMAEEGVNETHDKDDDTDVVGEAIMWASRITRLKDKKDNSLERHTGELRAQDFQEAIRNLMNELEYSTLRSKLKSKPDQKTPTLLLPLLDHIQCEIRELTIEGETREEREIRIRDTSAETARSMTKYLDSPFTYNDKYNKAMEFYRAKELNKALLEINDAIFAAMAHSTLDEVPHFGEFEESEDDDDSGDGVDGSQSNGEERPQKPRMVDISRIYFDLKWRQVEYLYEVKRYKLTAIYARHLLWWAATYRVKGVAGFHAIVEPDKICTILHHLGESECELGNILRSIHSASLTIARICQLEACMALERSLFETRQAFFEKMVEKHEDKEQLNKDCEDDPYFKQARFIVSKDRKRGYDAEKGQFTVDTLEKALQMAKDGNVIYLMNGIYQAQAGTDPEENANRKKNPAFQVGNDLIIVGQSVNGTVIQGSISKWGECRATFRRLKLMICDRDYAGRALDDEVYVMCGTLAFEGCTIESPVNTMFYVMSSKDEGEPKSQLHFGDCYINGQERCRRMVYFEGYDPAVSFSSCYLTDMYSAVSVVNEHVISRGSVEFFDTVLYEVQDAIKIVLNYQSNLSLTVTGCQFDMLVKDVNLPSYGISMAGGKCEMRNTLISMSTPDTNGLSLHSLKTVRLNMSIIETLEDTPRTYAIGDGLVMSEINDCVASGVDVTGFKTAFRIGNMSEEKNMFIFKNCTARSSSIAFQVEKKSSGKEEKLNMETKLDQCNLEACCNGVVMDDNRSRLDLTQVSISDIVKPIMITKAAKFRVALSHNEYRNSPEYLNLIGGDSTTSSSSTATASSSNSSNNINQKYEDEVMKMRAFLMARENLPLQQALEHDNYIHVHDQESEEEFVQRYQNFRDSKKEG